MIPKRFWPYIGAAVGLVAGLLLILNWKVLVVLLLAGLGYLVARWLVGEG